MATNDVGGFDRPYNSGPQGAALYQQNGQNANDTSSQLFQALLKQSMQQGQGGNGMAQIIPGLMSLFQSMGGSNASWSPGVMDSTYSMGGDG